LEVGVSACFSACLPFLLLLHVELQFFANISPQLDVERQQIYIFFLALVCFVLLFCFHCLHHMNLPINHHSHEDPIGHEMLLSFAYDYLDQ
jgi:hypothetical protein